MVDHLYGGTAGVLVALAEARLSGVCDFDAHAHAAAERLRGLVAAAQAPDPAAGPVEPAASSLYLGRAGHAASLWMWASVSGDAGAAEAARAAVRRVAGGAAGGLPVSTYQDLLLGEAGILLALVEIGDGEVHAAVDAISDRLVAAAQPADGGVDWYARDDTSFFMPNFSHGCAGIAYALARAAETLGREDLLDLAEAGGRRLVHLGARPDGTLAVPKSVPVRDPGTPVSHGWRHGPTGREQTRACR